MSQKLQCKPEVFTGFRKGHRFGHWVLPESGPITGAILAIQTPGENNLNTRQVFMAGSECFAARGFAVLVFDLYGVGQSSGRAEDINLHDWRGDLLKASHLMRIKFDAPLFVWGLRLGTLLAADFLISQADNTAGVLMWAPYAHGRTWVQDLAERATKDPSEGSGGPHNTTASCHKTMFRQSLLEELKTLSLNPTERRSSLDPATRVALIGISDITSVETSPRNKIHRLPPTLEILSSIWRSAGHEVAAQEVKTGQFWNTAAAGNQHELFSVSTQWLESCKPTLG